jgi:hypothetical protein
MPSLIYNSFLDDVFSGDIDCDSDTFKVLLTTSGYTENKDTANDRIDVSLGGFSQGSATITARKAVYYQVVGSAATDRLVAVIDFGSDVISTGGTWALTASTLRIQN